MVHLLDSGGKRRPKETDERKRVMPLQQRRFLLSYLSYIVLYLSLSLCIYIYIYISLNILYSMHFKEMG